MIIVSGYKIERVIKAIAQYDPLAIVPAYDGSRIVISDTAIPELASVLYRIDTVIVKRDRLGNINRLRYTAIKIK